MDALPRILLVFAMAFMLQGCRGQGSEAAPDPGPPPPSLVQRPWGLSEALLAALAGGRVAEVKTMTEHLPGQLSSQQAIGSLTDQTRGQQAMREETAGNRGFVYVGGEAGEVVKLSYQEQAGEWRLVRWESLSEQPARRREATPPLPEPRP